MQAAKAVPKKLLACNTKLKLKIHDRFIGYSENEAQQKFGEGGGYLLFIFRGQRSDVTIFIGVKLGYNRRKTGTIQVKKE